MQLIVTESGSILCSMSSEITAKAPQSTEDIDDESKWVEVTGPEIPEIELSGTEISDKMDFEFELGTISGVTCTRYKSSNVKIDGSEILLNELTLSGGEISASGYTGTLPKVTLNSVTSDSIHKADDNYPILLKDSTATIPVTLYSASGSLSITLIFSISDAGQTSVTAE